MDIYKIRSEILNGKTMSDLKLRVVFYARVSTEHDTQISSLENQVEFFTEYINNNKNWTYCGRYIDEGISGTSTARRENFNKMINDAKCNKFDLIVTKNVPRFARNTLDSISYTEQLLSNNVGVLFLNDNINTFLPDSDLRLAIMASIAQDEVRKLSENVRFGLKKSLDRGVILGGNNMYGYEKIERKLVPIPKEADVINKIYKLFSTGKYSYTSLRNKLVKLNIYDRNNKPFNLSTLKRILVNPKYKGYYCGNKTKKIDYKLKKRVKIDPKEWKIYENQEKIIPIVDKKLWNTVNLIINKRNNRNNKYNSYINKIYCAEHGTKYTKSNKNIISCSLYKKGKKYCESPLLKEDELTNMLKKIICKDDKNKVRIDEYIDKIVVKKRENNRYDLLLFISTKYNNNVVIKYNIKQ